MAESDLFDQAADDLYGLPPGDFTRARDARAKEVRSDGDREAADAIKGLRKPTVAAWALNQLSRSRAKDVERLVGAGEELRAAQEELLAGGDRAAFQEAAGRERELVADLSADATAMASEAGERGSGLQEKIAETLHAAALDEETADELRAGRLVREREAIGGFGGAAAAPSSPRARGGRGSPKAAARSKPPARAKRASGGKRTSDGKAAAKQAEQRQRVTAARTDERHARRELEAAERALEHAQERADAAAAHATEAAERAQTTAERVKEAGRTATAARKAHQKAERALQSAERSSSRRS